ncbi:peptidyl-glycine alpha-amidating monooxygenase isoform X2 [Ambystoma mexicanum]|uniref:peptidyl-glycine alpha-amidating monooxygenase isoform X2 n=1 Tax=Ambystoma mexicanum TaxID=8296 RepID=UPI0037E74C3D
MAGLANSLLLLLLFGLLAQSSCWGFRSPLSVFKRYKENARYLSDECLGPAKPLISSDSPDFSLDIRMPGVIPVQSDTYFCMSYRLPVDDEAYVVDFKPHANMNTVHHMLLFGCNMPSSNEDYWDCDLGTCTDKANILYAWAKNAPPTKLPEGVGFKVGGASGSKYFVLQVHYGDVGAFKDNHKDCTGVTLQLTSEKQPLIAGIYLMMSVNTVIPPGEKVTNSDIACSYKRHPMYPFAYRVHTHHLGKVVSGYRIRDGEWTLIGRQSPQLPQAFYPVSHQLDVSNGDTLAARCVFTGEGRTTDTHIGGTSADEMCNFYIMYYMEAIHGTSFMTCVQDGRAELFRDIPQAANEPIVVDPAMMMTHDHHSQKEMKNPVTNSFALQQPKREQEEVLDQGNFYSLISKLLGEREDVVHVHKYNPTERAESDLVAQIANVVQKKDADWSDARAVADHGERAGAVLIRDRIHKFHRLESTLRPPGNKIPPSHQLRPGAGDIWETERPGDFHLEEVIDWPGVNLKLGQVSGLALDPENNLVIFHRGDHVWNGDSFDRKFVYQLRGIGPIEQSAILVVDPSSSAIVKSTGRNLFYLPHGLTVDKDGNYWVTDVALHQVFKLGAQGGDDPLLVLGKAFQPGSDNKHFCQPTDVAVDPASGNFYVSDGYCNSRIMQFSPSGKFIMQWGEEPSSPAAKAGQFHIPHSLALVAEFGQLCVADRENGRIQCFQLENGQFVKEIKHKAFGSEVFAVSYAPGGLLYAVNGMPYLTDAAPVQGFVMNFTSGEIIDTFLPVRKSFDMPHDLVASEDGTVYVGDAHAKTVWKFSPLEKAEHRSVKKAGIEVQEITETEIFETGTGVRNKPKPSTGVVAKLPEKEKTVEQTESRVSFVLITTLLIIPVVVLIAIAIFIRWRKVKVYGDSEHKLESSSGGLLGKLRGKGSGGLNLGNFFASHKGYSRKGFDRLSTEGSDQEKDEDDGTDSEEEYSAPPPPPLPATASSSS